MIASLPYLVFALVVAAVLLGAIALGLAIARSRSGRAD
jgi:hypothetical protein